MQLSIDQKDIDKFLMIGDKVLIKPTRGEDTSGLYHKDGARISVAFSI